MKRIEAIFLAAEAAAAQEQMHQGPAEVAKPPMNSAANLIFRT